MPNRLWYRAARLLWPQADSSIAWAIVTDAGTPKRCWAATAPGATKLMNACWFRVPGAAYCFGDELADDGDVAGAGVADWDGLAGARFSFAGGDVPGAGVADWDGWAGARFTFAGADVGDLGRGAVFAAGWPRSWPVARTPGTVAVAGSPPPPLPA